MNGEAPSGGQVVPVPRRPTSRVEFGSEAILAPKGEFAIDIDASAATSISTHISIASRDADDGTTLTVSGKTGGWNGFSLLAEVAHATDGRTNRFPLSAAAWTQSGFAHLTTGQFDAATDAFTRALAIDPTARSARLGYARVLNTSGASSAALMILRTLLNELPNDVEVRVALAVALADAEGIDAALSVLQREPELSERTSAFFSARGSLLLAAGNFAAAKRDLRKVVRVNPHSAHARNVLGIVELKSGELGTAERRFREAVRVAPTYLEAFLNLLRLWLHERRHREVLASIEARYPDREGAPSVVSRIAGQAALADGDWTAAGAWLEASLAATAETSMRARVLNDLGVVSSRQGRHSDAQQRFWQSFRAEPTELAAVNRAKALLALNAPLDAAAWLGSATVPERVVSAERLQVLAGALNRGRLHANAAAIYEELLRVDPGNTASHGYLASLYVEMLTNPQRAKEVALQGLMRRPTDPMTLNNLSYALTLAGQFPEAAAALDAAESGPVDTAVAVYLRATRGLLALRQGQYAVGAALYDQALLMPQTAATRERLRAKRDYEVARARLAGAQLDIDAIAALQRAAGAPEHTYPYNVQAASLLARLGQGAPAVE